MGSAYVDSEVAADCCSFVMLGAANLGSAGAQLTAGLANADIDRTLVGIFMVAIKQKGRPWVDSETDASH